MAKISRNNQIVIYIIILVLVTIFFFYFYRQASITQTDVGTLNVTGKQPKNVISNATMNMDLNLFGTPKFLNLRSEVAPTQSFQSGTKNPFQPPQ